MCSPRSGSGRWTPCAVRCAHKRPPFPRLWTRTQRTTWVRGPCPPSRTPAPATPHWGHRATRTTPRRWPWARPHSRTRSPRRRSGCGSLGRTSAWTSPAPGSRESKAPRPYCSGGSPSRWRRPSASSASKSPLGAPRSRDRCCPGAWRRDGAPCAACPISRRMTGRQHPGHPAGPPRGGGGIGDGARPTRVRNRGGTGPVGAGARVPGQGGHLHRAVQGAPHVPDHAHAV